MQSSHWPHQIERLLPHAVARNVLRVVLVVDSRHGVVGDARVDAAPVRAVAVQVVNLKKQRFETFVAIPASSLLTYRVFTS
jgi:hypothetical protein